VRRAPRISARWKPVFLISIVVLVAATGLFVTAVDGRSRSSAACLFVAAGAMLFVAVRNGRPH
jgi:uncharacterized membrane protein